MSSGSEAKVAGPAEPDRHERLEGERFKLMEAYYANAIDVTILRWEQERIGAELRAVESRQAVIESNFDDWEEVMNLALRFSPNCARRLPPGRRAELASSSTPPCSTRSTFATDMWSKRPTKSPSIFSSLCRSSNTTMWWALQDSNL